MSEMAWDTREPCKTCPYRKDVPKGTWHKSEFENLLEQDAQQFGAAFGCHATRKLPVPQVCGGWLYDQMRRGVPSLALRLRIIRNPAAVKAIEEISDGGHKMYSSIEAMCRSNGVRVRSGR